MNAAFTELEGGAMLADNQAAAALANVAVYVDTMAAELDRKAAERGADEGDEFVVAYLAHIVELTAAAATEYAQPVGDSVRRAAFRAHLPAKYHVMSAQQALEVSGDMRAMALAGAIPDTLGATS